MTGVGGTGEEALPEEREEADTMVGARVTTSAERTGVPEEDMLFSTFSSSLSKFSLSLGAPPCIEPYLLGGAPGSTFNEPDGEDSLDRPVHCRLSGLLPSKAAPVIFSAPRAEALRRRLLGRSLKLPASSAGRTLKFRQEVLRLLQEPLRLRG